MDYRLARSRIVCKAAGMWRKAVLTGLIILIALPATGQEAPPGLAVSLTAKVAKVLAGDRVALAGGRLVHLAGIDTPDPAARQRLTRLVQGRQIDLLAAGPNIPIDRHGTLHAHLLTPSGVWVQGALLKAGLARVVPGIDGPAASRAMLGLEATARAARRGLWSRPVFRVRTPGELAGDVDSFQLMEGRVVSAALIGGRAYLNFGPDRMTDTTVIADPPVAAALARAGVDPAKLLGHLVRVRGWVGQRKGPEIRLAAPESLEIVE